MRGLLAFLSHRAFYVGYTNQPHMSFFLKMGRVFSFSSNFALILVHLPKPAENASGKIPFSSILIFSASVVMHSTFCQNV